jgi:hydroxymethylpyrimidine/phosphomethylpyrimidine kinase
VSLPAVLVIAATDSSGGAGLARDLATLAPLPVEARCVVTAVTAQSHARVTAVHPLPAQIIRAQLEAALECGPVDAIKIGMLATAEAVRAVAAGLPPHVPVVLDPVLVSSSGGVLLSTEGQRALAEMLPRVTLLTPNLPEAAALLGQAPADTPEGLIGHARQLLARGPAAVLLKGGHGSGEAAVDHLVDAHAVQTLSSPRLPGTRRGTGCQLASGIAAGLAMGLPLREACERARGQVLLRFSAP